MTRTGALALTLALLGACAPGPRTPRTPARAVPLPALVVPPRTEAAEVAAERSPWVERAMASLSLREKAGQMVVAWSGGTYDEAELSRLAGWVERDGIGGVILSIGLPHEYAAKIDALQRRARVPLLVMTDMESGPGMRLNGSRSSGSRFPRLAGTDFPPVMAVAATGADTLAFEVGRAIAGEGRAVGVGLTLSPVLDVNSDPANPIINVRSFGEDPREVARFGAAYVRGLHAGGMLAAGKHFPGHGDTRTDSHMELAVVGASRARLDSVELVPFRAAVQAGVDAILVGHIAVAALGAPDVPASLSPRVVDGVLRREMGFGGLVFTDALNMHAVTRRYGAGEAVLRAVEAGADLLLQPPDPASAVRALVGAVESGRIPAARIDASVRRILAAKERAGLAASGGRVSTEGVAAGVGTQAPARLAEEIARRSITLVRDRRGLVPFAPGARRVLSITYADAAGAGSAFDAALAQGGVSVSSARVNGATGKAKLAALAARADSVDVVVVQAYVQPVQYRGTVEAGGGFSAFVERMAARGRPVVVVSFGSPYLLRSFPSVPSYVAAWGGAAVSQRAAARALLGREAITGRLPVSIPPEHPRGTGITRPARVPSVSPVPESR